MYSQSMRKPCQYRRAIDICTTANKKAGKNWKDVKYRGEKYEYPYHYLLFEPSLLFLFIYYYFFFFLRKVDFFFLEKSLIHGEN